MSPLPSAAAHLVGFNAILGVLVGALTARIPEFSAIGMPTFLWLVAGLFVSEMIAGLLLKAHPSSLFTMPWRAAALCASFIGCYGALAVLS